MHSRPVWTHSARDYIAGICASHVEHVGGRGGRRGSRLWKPHRSRPADLGRRQEESVARLHQTVVTFYSGPNGNYVFPAATSRADLRDQLCIPLQDLRRAHVIVRVSFVERNVVPEKPRIYFSVPFDDTWRDYERASRCLRPADKHTRAPFRRPL